MYIVQINCRMKANRLLFDYLINESEITDLVSVREESYRLEMNWVNIKNKVSKAYFMENSVAEMAKLGEQMMGMFEREKQMWKEFIRVTK